MAKWRFWTEVSTKWPNIPSRPRPTSDDAARGIAWPFPGQWVVRIKDPKAPYFVDVEIVYDSEDGPVVTGIAVRTGAPLDPKAEGLDWREGGSFDAVSARDVRRLPLATYCDAALAIVQDPFQSDEDLRRSLSLRGEPGETSFYESIGDLHRQLSARGADPVREIAARASARFGKDVSENTVHQWIFRARELRFLERGEASGTMKTKPKARRKAAGRRKR